jgi:hypothetical protein
MWILKAWKNGDRARRHLPPTLRTLTNTQVQEYTLQDWVVYDDTMRRYCEWYQQGICGAANNDWNIKIIHRNHAIPSAHISSVWCTAVKQRIKIFATIIHAKPQPYQPQYTICNEIGECWLIENVHLQQVLIIHHLLSEHNTTGKRRQQ